MIYMYIAIALCGIFYGCIFTYTSQLKQSWTAIAHIGRLFLAGAFLIYLLQATDVPPILGTGIFLAGMWIWLLIYTQRM